MRIPKPPNIDAIVTAAEGLKRFRQGDVIDESSLMAINRASNQLADYRRQSLELAELQRLWHDPTPGTFEALREKALGFYNYVGDDAISLKAASLRSGSPHAEAVYNDRPRCAICGYCDEGLPDPIFHPEFYLGSKTV